MWKRFESSSFTLCFLWPLVFYPFPDVEPLRPLVQRGSMEMIQIKRKQRHSLAPEMLRIERLGNERSLAAHLDWDKCKLLRVFFSSSRPMSTKRGISTIDPTNTWGSVHWENSNFSHMGEIVLFFTQNWGKQQHLGLYLLQIMGEIMYSTLFCVILFSVNFLSFAHDLSCYCRWMLPFHLGTIIVSRLFFAVWQ
jgi:hypothetical protein